MANTEVTVKEEVIPFFRVPRKAGRAHWAHQQGAERRGAVRMKSSVCLFPGRLSDARQSLRLCV